MKKIGLRFQVKLLLVFLGVLLFQAGISITYFGEKVMPQVFAATQTIQSDTLSVTVDDSFPRVLQYTWRNTGDVLYGQEDTLNLVRINGTDYSPSVQSSVFSDKVTYTMTFSGISVVISCELKVADNILEFNVTGITDNSSTKVRTLYFPNHSLISIRDNQNSAYLSAEWYGENSGSTLQEWHDEFTTLASKSTDASDVNRSYIILNTNKLAATIYNNCMTDYARMCYKTENKGAYKKLGAWNGIFTYRGGTNDEITEQPYSKVIIINDQNGDLAVDWQDGAIGYRNTMTPVYGAETLRNSISYIVGHYNACAWPYLRVLDNIKKLSNYIDGFGQMVELKGWNGYPDTDHYNMNYGLGTKDDLNVLINGAANYNTKIGVHISPREASQESHYWSSLLDYVSENPSWYGADTTYYFDVFDDVSAGNMETRLDSMETDFPNMGWIYVDVVNFSDWEGWKWCKKLNDLGLIIGDEFSCIWERFQAWSHQNNYDGFAGNYKGNGSKIVRFIRNHEQDVFPTTAILQGKTHTGFMSYAGQYNIMDTVRDFYTINLPTKYMQNSAIRKWASDDTQIDFENGTCVKNESGTINLYDKDGYKIASGGTTSGYSQVFIPWDPSEETKIYHWNSTGGNSTWHLPSSWTGQSTVKLYQLTDLGKAFVTDLTVTNGQVIINATANMPYIIYKTTQTNPAITWGEGSLVKDPGFDSHGFGTWSRSSTYGSTSHIYTANDSNNNTYLEVYGNNGADATISQSITGLTGGKTYVASVFVQVTDGRNATIGVKDYGGNEIAKSVSVTNIQGGNPQLYSSYFQRIKVVFDVPVGNSTATLYLKAANGTSGSKAMFDDVRIQEATGRTKQGTHLLYEDFENCDETTGPFIDGQLKEVSKHLSLKNYPYTNDTINGNYSLKLCNEPTNGLAYRTLPSTLQLQPNTTYTIGFKYMSPTDSMVNLVVRTDSGGVGNDALNVSIPSTATGLTGSVCKTFTTGNYSDYYIGIVQNTKGPQEIGFVIDDFYVDVGVDSRINFEPGTTSTPAGFEKDNGYVYSAGRGYGWDADISANTRERNVNSDKTLDTFAYAVDGTVRNWRYDLPNGKYKISLACGDASGAQGPHRVVVEGVTLVNDQSTAANQFYTITDSIITVTDGRLDVAIGGAASDTMLNYIKIKSVVYEGFENGFTNWTTLNGTPSTSTVHHSGAYSYVLDEDTDCISYSFNQCYGIGEVWFYDDSSDTSAMTMAFIDKQNAVSGSTVVGIGVNTGTSLNNYVYRIGSTWTESTKARTTGWHKLTFDYSDPDADGKLYIDGTQIATAAGCRGMSHVQLGDWWADGNSITACYDDVRIYKNILKDGFENGFGEWSADGTPSTSTVQKQGGTYSYILNEDQDYIVRTFDERSGIGEVWFYDDASDTTAKAMALIDKRNMGGPVVGIGVNTDSYSNQYVYRVGSSYYASNVTRTSGWHKFTFDYRDLDADGKLYIDDTQIGTATGCRSMSYIELGDGWSDGKSINAYFDDLLIKE